MNLLSAGSVCTLAPLSLTFICTISKKGSSSCLTRHHRPWEIPQALIAMEADPGLWAKDVASDMVQGVTSARQNSNVFGMDDLSLSMLKSVHSQAVLLSPGGEV